MSIAPLGDKSAVRESETRMLAPFSGAHADGDQVARRSKYDSVTGLPNRSVFHTWLGTALNETHPPHQTVTLAFLNLDDFKSLNGTFGRRIGDEVLRTVGARLSGALRADDMVSRLGNDEFGCVIVGMPNKDFYGTIARTLLAIVSEPMVIGALEFTVHASIGIATQATDNCCANSMMQQAARTMYRAKLDKSGYAFFESRIA
jgi:diguanylate cyclase